MVLKLAMPGKVQFRLVKHGVDFIFPKQGDIHYIGGAEVLPPPLEAERESAMIKGLGTKTDN